MEIFIVLAGNYSEAGEVLLVTTDKSKAEIARRIASRSSSYTKIEVQIWEDEERVDNGEG